MQDNNYLHHYEPFKVFFSYLELKKTIKVPTFKLGFPQIKGIETAYSKESPFSVCFFDNTCHMVGFDRIQNERLSVLFFKGHMSLFASSIFLNFE